MGTTLQHGIFLPAEGERNCYAGLASNWTILDGVVGGYSSHAANITIHVTAADKEAWNGKADASALTAHTGNTTIHVTAADKEAWNGKADASALTAHTGNTTIHVTAEDKSKWDAVTSKADDSDVVHKSGNETVGGIKTFDSNTYIYNSDNTSTTPNLYLRSSKIEISSQGNTSGIQDFTYLDKNKTVYAYIRGAVQSNGSAVKIRAVAKDSSDNLVINELQMLAYTNGNKAIFPSYSNEIDLGVSNYKWKSFNGVEPSSLSLPNLSAGVDISGYITNLNKGVNTYTPPANGWLNIRIRKTSLVHASLMIYQTGGLLSSCETDEFDISGTNLPVIANQNVEIYIYADVLVSAKFYPCQGNI